MPPRTRKKFPAPEQSPLFEEHAAAPPARSAIDPDIATLGAPATTDYIPVTEAKPGLTEQEQAQLSRLVGFRALLTTFGEMNSSDNFRNSFEFNPDMVRAKLKPQGLADPEVQQASLAKRETLELLGRAQVTTMLGFDKMVKDGVLTKAQAETVKDASYSKQKEIYLGLDPRPKKARISALGKANRRITKLEKKK